MWKPSSCLFHPSEKSQCCAENNPNIDSRRWTMNFVALLAWQGSSQLHSLKGPEYSQTWLVSQCKINLRDTTLWLLLPRSTTTPPCFHCCPIQYIHHSFINSGNSSLVNCLGKFNFKWKLLKRERDIIKLQGCPSLSWEGGVRWGHSKLCSSAPHCSVSVKSYTHV